MDIIKIANYIWKNSKSLDFGNENEWNSKLFLEQWWRKKLGKDYEKYKSGWYWFTLNMTNKEIYDIKNPGNLPIKACNFRLTAHKNVKIFSNYLINKNNIIYNGHDNNIKKRIRAHYALNNDKTSALGIKKYPLSKKSWKISIFSEPTFDEKISEQDKQRIITLMHSKIGRGAVESAWRTKYGWPILCKL